MAELRSQKYVNQALEDVGRVGAEDESIQKTYASMCHKLPILIHTNGLMQTVAFIEAKASSNNAHQLLREHIAGVLGFPATQLVAEVAKSDVMVYIRQSRTVTEAWIYYKRFVESILGFSVDVETEVLAES